MKTFVSLFAILFFGLVSSSQAQAVLPPDSMEIGRKYVDWFLEGKVDSLWAYTTERFQNQAGSPDAYEERSEMIAIRAGVREEVVEDKYVRRNGMPQFWHTANFSNMPEPLVIRMIITSGGKIDGMGMNPQSQNPPTDN